MAARSKTLPQFESINTTPHVILSPCDPPGWRQNVMAGRAALKYALDTGAPWVLFVEDDIDLAPDFREAVIESQASGFEVVYLYVHDRPDRGPVLYGNDLWTRITAGEGITPQVIKAKRYGYLYGSQAVLMTRQQAFRAWAVTLENQCATDTSFIKAWARQRLPVGIRVPHVVQHRADKTLHERRKASSRRKPEWQVSLSYPLARSPQSLVADNAKPTAPEPQQT